jgi:hypothetical protein
MPCADSGKALCSPLWRYPHWPSGSGPIRRSSAFYKRGPVRASERRSVAPGCNRLRHPSPGRDIFTSLSGAYQQPHCKMDARISSKRLANPGATLGHLPLVENVWTGCSVRTACRQSARSLISNPEPSRDRKEVGFFSDSAYGIKQSQAQLLLGLLLPCLWKSSEKNCMAVVCQHLD